MVVEVRLEPADIIRLDESDAAAVRALAKTGRKRVFADKTVRRCYGPLLPAAVAAGICPIRRLKTAKVTITDELVESMTAAILSPEVLLEA